MLKAERELRENPDAKAEAQPPKVSRPLDLLFNPELQSLLGQGAAEVSRSLSPSEFRSVSFGRSETIETAAPELNLALALVLRRRKAGSTLRVCRAFRV